MREFPKLSSRSIAELCGVGVDMVLARRPQVSENDTSQTVTGSDGKEYPAARKPPSLPVERPFALPGDPLPDRGADGEDAKTGQGEGKPDP
jgi:hypothetical protein